MPLTGGRWSVADEVFNALLEGVDEVIAEAIVREFGAHGITADLLYNRNFRGLTGGPKWLREDDPQQACFRKYIRRTRDGGFHARHVASAAGPGFRRGRALSYQPGAVAAAPRVHRLYEVRLDTQSGRHSEFVRFFTQCVGQRIHPEIRAAGLR